MNALAYQEGPQKIILFDESHDQYFSGNRYQLSLDLLRNSGDYSVRTLGSTKNITTQELQDVDILVITNPYKNFSNGELDNIKGFVQNGGDLFLLSSAWANVQNLNVSHPNHTELNRILTAIGLASTCQFTNETIINTGTSGYTWVDDSHQLPLTQTDFINPILGGGKSRIGWSIERVLLFSSAINISDASRVVATAHPYSKTEVTNRTNPVWLVAIEYSFYSRIVLCGSSFIFSNISRYVSSGGSNPWITAQDYNTGYTFDNQKLWYNIFAYLSTDFVNFSPLLLFFLIPIFCVGAAIVFKDKLKTISLKRTKKLPEEKEEEQVLKRAELLRKARMALAERNKKEAASIYRRAAAISLKIDDQDSYEKFLTKAEILEKEK